MLQKRAFKPYFVYRHLLIAYKYCERKLKTNKPGKRMKILATSIVKRSDEIGFNSFQFFLKVFLLYYELMS